MMKGKKPHQDVRGCGERSLWCAVVLAAIDDAIGRRIPVDSASATTRARVRDEARDWLLKPNRDFDFVCSLAGFDPDAVREGVVPLLTASGPSDAPHLGAVSGSKESSASHASESGTLKHRRARLIEALSRADDSEPTQQRVGTRSQKDTHFDLPSGTKDCLPGDVSRQPGVVSNFGDDLGTGGGSTAQHFPQMEFSK
jgi:hypothetical protein